MRRDDSGRERNGYGDGVARPEGEGEERTPGKRTRVEALVEEIRAHWRMTRRPRLELGGRPGGGKNDGLMAGGDIFLAEDALEDPSRERYLIAHELAHVAQTELPAGDGATIADAEAEARAIGEAFAAGRTPPRPKVPLAAGVDAGDDPADQLESVEGGVRLQGDASLLIDIAWLKGDPGFSMKGGSIMAPARMPAIMRAWKPIVWWMTDEDIAAATAQEITGLDLKKKVDTYYFQPWVMQICGLPPGTEVSWTVHGDGAMQVNSLAGIPRTSVSATHDDVKIPPEVLARSYQVLESTYGEKVKPHLKEKGGFHSGRYRKTDKGAVAQWDREGMENMFVDGKAAWDRILGRLEEAPGGVTLGSGTKDDAGGAIGTAGSKASGGASGGPAGTGGTTGQGGTGTKEPAAGSKTTHTGDAAATGTKPGESSGLDEKGKPLPGTSVTDGVRFSNDLGAEERKRVLEFLETMNGKAAPADPAAKPADPPKDAEPKQPAGRMYGTTELHLLDRLDGHGLKDEILEALKAKGDAPAPAETAKPADPMKASSGAKDTFTRLWEKLEQADDEERWRELGYAPRSLTHKVSDAGASHKGQGDDEAHANAGKTGKTDSTSTIGSGRATTMEGGSGKQLDRKIIYPRLPNGQIRHGGSHLWAGKEVGFSFVPTEQRNYMFVEWIVTPKGERSTHVAKGSSEDWPHRDQKPWTTTFKETGIYEIHAFVDMTHYKAGFAEPIEIEVKTEFQRLAEREEEAFGAFAEWEDENAHFPYNGEKYAEGKKHTGTLKDKVPTRTIEERIADFAGDRSKLEHLRDTYKDKGNAGKDIVEHCEHALRQLDEREAKMTAMGKDGWKHFEVRGTFQSEKNGIEDAELKLVGLARRGEDKDGKTTSILIKIIDASHVWDGGDSEFSSPLTTHEMTPAGVGMNRNVVTFTKALKQVFEVMAKEYPPGRVSILAAKLTDESLATTREVEGYQLHSGTLWKDVKSVAYHPAVQLGVNAAAIAATVFIPGAAVVTLPLMTAYNAVDTLDSLATLEARGRATTADRVEAGVLIGVDLLPFLGRLKVVGKMGKTAVYAMDAAQVVANTAVLTEKGIRDLTTFRDHMVSELANDLAEIERLEAQNKSDPQLTALREAYAKKVDKLRGAAAEKFKELAAQNALMIMAPVAFNHMTKTFQAGGGALDEAAAGGLGPATVVHEPGKPIAFEAETGRFRGDRTKTTPEQLDAAVKAAEKENARQREVLAEKLGTTPEKVTVERGGSDNVIKPEGDGYKVTIPEERWFSKALPDLEAKAAKLKSRTTPAPEVKPEAGKPAETGADAAVPKKFKYAVDDPAELAKLEANYPDKADHIADDEVVYRWCTDKSGMGGQNGTTFWQTKKPNDAHRTQYLVESTMGELRKSGDVRKDPFEQAQGGESGESVMVIHKSGTTTVPGKVTDKIRGYTRSNEPVYHPDDPDYVRPTEPWFDHDRKPHFPSEEIDGPTSKSEPTSAQATTTRSTAKVADLVSKDHLAVGAELDSRAQADEILAALGSGDRNATTRLGLDPLPQGFDPRGVEWGLGAKEGGKLVIIRGDTQQIDWDKFPELKPLAHTHPYAPSRALASPGADGGVSIEDLVSVGHKGDLGRLMPSAGDVAFCVREGLKTHTVVTPYVHKGGKLVGNPKAGDAAPVPITMEIKEPVVAGTYDGGETPVFKTEVVARAGGETLWSGELYSVHAPETGSHVQVGSPPAWVKPSTGAPPAPRTTAAPMRPPKTELEQLAYEDYQTLMKSEQDYAGKFHDEAWYERYEARWVYDIKNRVWIKPDGGGKAKPAKVFDGDAPDGKPWDGRSVYDYLAGNEATSTFKPFVDTLMAQKITVNGTVVTKDHVIAEIDKLKPLGRDEDFIRHEVKQVYRKPILDAMLAPTTPEARVARMREITQTLASSDKGAVFEDFVKNTQARNAESHVLVSQEKMAKHPTTPVELKKDRYLDLFEDGTITEAKAGDGAPDDHELTQLEDNLKLLRAGAFVDLPTASTRVERLLYVYRSVDGARRRVQLIRDVLEDKSLAGRCLFEVWTPAGERRIINSIDSLEAEKWLLEKPGTK